MTKDTIELIDWLVDQSLKLAIMIQAAVVLSERGVQPTPRQLYELIFMLGVSFWRPRKGT